MVDIHVGSVTSKLFEFTTHACACYVQKDLENDVLKENGLHKIVCQKRII